MHLIIRTDFSSIRFIRCYAMLPNSPYGVGGTGFLLSSAIARCKSEEAERLYYLDYLKPVGLKPVGMAAHPTNMQFAIRNARQEVVEAQIVKEFNNGKAFKCYKISIGDSFVFGFKKVGPYGYFAFIRATIQEKPMLFTDVSSSIFSSLIKAWEGFRNPKFFKLKRTALERYNKAAVFLTDETIRNIQFVRSSEPHEGPSINGHVLIKAQSRNHNIAYYVSEEES